LKGAELLKMSHRDGLTGLYNQAYMQEQLERELARCRRSGHDLSVIMFDVDHFKQVNDKHGHQAGDEVLRRIATLIKDCVRSADLAARYGGEEFLLILPDSDQKGAFLCAERLRRTVEQEVVHAHQADVSVTISLGIACYSVKTRDLSRHDIVRAADMALYESKHFGRNRTTVANTVGQQYEDKENIFPEIQGY
jgi:diguanylate cyclase (GGDEF)-like protein